VYLSVSGNCMIKFLPVKIVENNGKKESIPNVRNYYTVYVNE